MSLYLGIDFGTSTNYITRWDEEKKKAVPIVGLSGYGSSKNNFPNVIYYQRSGIPIIGEPAFEKLKSDPSNAVYAVKRRIGEDKWTCHIENINKDLTAYEVTRDIFSKIREEIQKQFGGQYIDGAVISVPYSYQHKERSVIEGAAKAAGIRVVGLIEEPIAAALSYGMFNTEIEVGTREKVLIFDLGGGTFDVTIFEFLREPDCFKIEVLNTAGHKNLGGNDIDELLKNKIVDSVLQIPLEERNPKDQNKVLLVANEIKEALSEDESCDVFKEDIYGSKELEWEIEVKELESLLKNGFLSKITDVLDDAIFDVENLEPEDIDKVVLVGGSSNIPIIHKELTKYFGKEPIKTSRPEELVGEGAGIFCGMKLNGDKMPLKVVQKISHAIGVKVGGKFKPLLARNSEYEKWSPTIEYFTISGTEGTEAEIEIYQGNSKNIKRCSYVGRIYIDTDDFSENKIGISLGTDKNGKVIYKLYDINNNIVKQDEMN